MKQKLEQVIANLQESKFDDNDEAFTRGWNRAMEFAIRRLEMEAIEIDILTSDRQTSPSGKDDTAEQIQE